MLDSKIPSGPLQDKWTKHQLKLRLVNPSNKRKYQVIVVGTGLAGSSAAASLAELGYQVKVFCLQDSPRRAHSIAAQGGINAAKNYPNDGDSVERLFYDTVKGGDFRSREANVYRLPPRSHPILPPSAAPGGAAPRGRRGAGDGRLFERVLPFDERLGLQRDGHLARVQKRRAFRQPVLHADPPDLHPGGGRAPIQADADVRVAPERRPHLGAQEKRGQARAPRNPRRRARL